MTVPEIMPDVQAEFMFGLIDYQTWNLYIGNKWVGQLTVNHADRSVTLGLDDMSNAEKWFPQCYGYRTWIAWLRTHVRPGRSRI